MQSHQRYVWQFLLIAFLLGLSWLAMMAIHELGHVLHAVASGARVERVVLHPLAISRTDVSPNPHPQFVAWGGAVWGTILPLALWGVTYVATPRHAYLAAFFAGFCCLANGLYLAVGSVDGVGDAGDLLRHGAARWQLWLFGLPVSLLGLWVWHGLGPRFGFGPTKQEIDRRTVIALGLVLAVTIVVELLLSRDEGPVATSFYQRGWCYAARRQMLGHLGGTAAHPHDDRQAARID